MKRREFLESSRVAGPLAFSNVNTQRHSSFSKIVIAFCVAIVVSSSTKAASNPNVLFIAIDDMNDYVGCLGGYPGRSSTPSIDRLAERGVLFTNAHCSSPLCNPSRTSLLTGRAPSRTGCYSNSPIWHEVVTDAVVLPQYFKVHGYHVVGGGKIFHTGKPNHPHHVWHEFVDQVMDPTPKDFPLHRIDKKLLRSGNFDWGPLDKSDLEMGDGQIVQWAMDFVKKKQTKPFFLAVGIFRPHLPFYAPRSYFEQIRLEDVRVPAGPDNDLEDIPRVGLEMRNWKLRYYKTVTRLNRLDEVVQGYLASCSFADGLVDRLIRALDSSPNADNTVIVLWSDHGWHLGEKRKVNKHTLWEDATHVPMIVVAPRITTPGTRCAEAVSLLDIYPTLIELCDLPHRNDLDGQSLLPLLRSPTARRAQPALITFGYKNHAVRDERWKYIRYRDGGEELYDHDLDPNEWTNLASDPELAHIKRELAIWLPKTDADPVAANAFPNVAPSSHER